MNTDQKREKCTVVYYGKKLYSGNPLIVRKKLKDEASQKFLFEDIGIECPNTISKIE